MFHAVHLPAEGMLEKRSYTRSDWIRLHLEHCHAGPTRSLTSLHVKQESNQDANFQLGTKVLATCWHRWNSGSVKAKDRSFILGSPIFGWTLCGWAICQNTTFHLVAIDVSTLTAPSKCHQERDFDLHFANFLRIPANSNKWTKMT